jgi:hypothetical protein
MLLVASSTTEETWQTTIWRKGTRPAENEQLDIPDCGARISRLHRRQQMLRSGGAGIRSAAWERGVRRKVDRTASEAELQELGGSPYSSAKLHQRNAKFIAAMAAAIRAGLERPARVGIDRTPGTRNPTWALARR